MLTVQIPTHNGGYARTTMQPNEPQAIEAIPTLPTLMQGMAKALEDAHSALTTLQERIDPILRPQPDGGVAVDRKPEGMTMLAGGVYDAVESVSDLASRMRRITQAIDL